MAREPKTTTLTCLTLYLYKYGSHFPRTILHFSNLHNPFPSSFSLQRLLSLLRTKYQKSIFLHSLIVSTQTTYTCPVHTASSPATTPVQPALSSPCSYTRAHPSGLFKHISPNKYSFSLVLPILFFLYQSHQHIPML